MHSVPGLVQPRPSVEWGRWRLLPGQLACLTFSDTCLDLLVQPRPPQIPSGKYFHTHNPRMCLVQHLNCPLSRTTTLHPQSTQPPLVLNSYLCWKKGQSSGPTADSLSGQPHWVRHWTLVRTGSVVSPPTNIFGSDWRRIQVLHQVHHLWESGRVILWCGERQVAKRVGIHMSFAFVVRDGIVIGP